MNQSKKLQSWNRESLSLSEVYVDIPKEIFEAGLLDDEFQALEIVRPWCSHLVENRVKSGVGFLIFDGDSYPDINNEQRRLLTERFAKSIGEPFTHRSAHLNQGLLCDVKDKGYRFTSHKDQSFHNSNQEAVEHTESTELPEPIGMFMLSVINPAFRGGASRLVCISTLVSELAERFGASHISELKQSFVFDTGRGERTTAPILSYDENGQVHFRWMMAFLMNGKEATAHWNDYTERVLKDVVGVLEDLRISFSMKRGDIGVFNNRALLHGRDDFEGSPDHPPRWLIRSWFK